MTNDLKDPNRIHMTFKSSQYGSFNHSHADQNSFVIQAFGEGLAVHSGHYDRYGSSHDQNITRQSFAHNTITINGGIGQNVFDINAKGSIGEFVNHVEFDSATGKAAEAYGGRLNRFDRNIIYLRPDVYVVIDDLEAKTGEEAEFEWRMNAMSDVSEADNIDGKQNTLLIKKGDANLKTEIMYPYVTFSSNAITDPSTGETTYRFISPIDNKEYAPDGITDVQRMMCFKTGKTSDTKMVAVMSLYQDSEEPPQVVSENYNDYIKLVCKDKTVYANLKKSGESVTTVDGYEFDGSGLTISNTSALLTNGTYLKKDGKLLLSCSRVSTVALGQSELSFSSDDDFKVVITNDNPFFANLSAKTLCDCKERIISSSIGVDCEKNGNESVFNCQKGNYTFIEENIGVISPFSLKAENISVLNNKDGKAAICWEEKQGKTYDVKIGDNVISDVSSPYYFDMEAEAVSVSVREKFDNLLGEWSEDFVYASAYENRLAGNIVFSEAADKVQAKSLSPEGLGNRNMLLCLYNNNILTECVSAEQNGMYLKAEIRKPNINEQVAAYVWDDNYTPVMAKARYKSDSVALTGIYADGKLIDGFSDNKNSYKIYFDRNQRIFPVLYAETADGSTKAKISYDFNEFSAKINVVSQNGETRDIDIKFSSNPDNILHPIKGADRAEDFVLDEGVDADLNGKSSMVSKDSIAYLEFAGDKKIQCNVFTNFKGHENGISGSRAYSDRVPNVGNRLEMECIPGFATGCDYIVLPYGEYYLNYTKLNAENRNSFFNIELSEPAEMYILAVDEHNSLKQDGFLETDTFAQGRYLNPLSPENKYYNLKLNGKSEDYITTYVNSYFYPVKYEGLELWDYVLPLEGFDMGKPEKTYNKYLSEKPGKEQFTLAGDLSSIIERSMKFKYLYKKSFDAGEIRLHLSNEENNGDNMIIIIKEKAPETF